jgi:hypothetical protein
MNKEILLSNRGKRSLKANYNCIKYFGCKCDSNNLNNKENKLIIYCCWVWQVGRPEQYYCLYQIEAL